MVRDRRMGLPARARRAAQPPAGTFPIIRALTQLRVAVAPRALFRPLSPQRCRHRSELIAEH
jgi:hypothetical protein